MFARAHVGSESGGHEGRETPAPPGKGRHPPRREFFEATWAGCRAAAHPTTFASCLEGRAPLEVAERCLTRRNM